MIQEKCWNGNYCWQAPTYGKQETYPLFKDILMKQSLKSPEPISGFQEVLEGANFYLHQGFY